jgi:hypothetical protein
VFLTSLTGILSPHTQKQRVPETAPHQCGSVSLVTFVEPPSWQSISAQPNKRGNAHACGEVLSAPGNAYKPYLPRRKPDRRKHIAARSNQTERTVMKQSDLEAMSIGELLMLHERITAVLAAKITAEKEALADQLKQTDKSVH